MSEANAVVWINQVDGDLPDIYIIPKSLFGDKLPPLDDFVAAVTMAPEDDDDSTVQPTDDSGEDEEEDEEEGKRDRKDAPKRAKVDPVTKAFRDHVSASAYMAKRLKELNIHALTSPWANVWNQPFKVVLSVGFEL